MLTEAYHLVRGDMLLMLINGTPAKRCQFHVLRMWRACFQMRVIVFPEAAHYSRESTPYEVKLPLNIKSQSIHN